jgi:hypothetical protein
VRPRGRSRGKRARSRAWSATADLLLNACPAPEDARRAFHEALRSAGPGSAAWVDRLGRVLVANGDLLSYERGSALFVDREQAPLALWRSAPLELVAAHLTWAEADLIDSGPGPASRLCRARLAAEGAARRQAARLRAARTVWVDATVYLTALRRAVDPAPGQVSWARWEDRASRLFV